MSPFYWVIAPLLDFEHLEKKMQARLILLFFSLITFETVFCDRQSDLQYSIGNKCPPREEIPKCHCNVGSDKELSVHCNGFKTDSDFHNHLKSLQGYKLRLLDIENYNASSISTDVWQGQDIEQIFLDHVEVDDASFKKGNRHFRWLENSLDTLQIISSFRKGIRPLNMKLDHLKKLEYAVFENNIIPEVGNDWFTLGPKMLSFLVFKDNGIEELGDEVFASLNNLETLELAGNHLNRLTRSMLPKSARLLSSLDLSDNKIRNLPNDIFSDMPSLKTVILNDNLIQTLQEEIGRPIASHVTWLGLYDNPLQCDQKMQWVCNTNLLKDHGICSSPPEKKGSSVREICQ